MRPILYFPKDISGFKGWLPFAAKKDIPIFKVLCYSSCLGYRSPTFYKRWQMGIPTISRFSATDILFRRYVVMGLNGYAGTSRDNGLIMHRMKSLCNSGAVRRGERLVLVSGYIPKGSLCYKNHSSGIDFMVSECIVPEREEYEIVKTWDGVMVGAKIDVVDVRAR